MTDSPTHQLQPIAAVIPTGYATSAHFLELPKPEDLTMLSQVAMQVLSDPFATQQLCDRVIQLMQQDLLLQQECHNYGRRG